MNAALLTQLRLQWPACALLAQSLSEHLPDNAVRYWMEVLFFVLGGTYVCVKLFKELVGDPPPDRRFALKVELAQLDRDSKDRDAANAARVDELRLDMHNRLKEMSAYIHEGVHDLRQDLHASAITADEGREKIHARINVLNELMHYQRGQMDAAINAVKTVAESVQRSTATS